MAINNNSKWVDMSIEELISEVNSAEEKMVTMKFENGLQGLDNPLQVRQNRRDIARMKTELRKRELAAMSPEDLAKRDNIRRRRRK